MFEAMVTLCLAAAGGNAPGTAADAGPCRVMLLPGHGAPDRAGCAATLAARPPAILTDLPAGTPAPFCAPRPAATLDFAEVAPGVHVHRGEVAEPDPDNRGDVANIGFVIGDDGVAVIDAGGSRALGEAVYLAVRAVTDKPVTHLILTHMHPDHVLGAEPLREAGAEVIGHAGLGRALAERADSYLAGFAAGIGQPGFAGSRIIGPDREVAGAETIDLGGRILDLVPRATAHSPNDLTVFDRASATLFAGDLVFDDHAPALDGSLRGWQAVLAAMRAEAASRVVPGHGGPVLPWPEGAAALLRYLDVLSADTRAALDAGLPLSAATDVIGQDEAANWRLFGLFNARNATVAYTEMEWD
ncbi:MAG: MBL fold metallo-hydrolase [Alphaproteobacteria bacterium HGW-Alphaproteobacteria-6]|nr:MAG: MBL fold metallo-hydrolase [Alphaproteobacteria bacterium HGW-Alphaproteobacteria-6]